MSTCWTLYVEGRDDQRFFECLMRHWKITSVETDIIGGGVSHIHKIEQNIRRRIDDGNKIAVILDADANFTNRYDEFQKTTSELTLPIDRFFLLPNNNNPGCLETLLEQICVSDHRVIYDCLNQYEDCIQTKEAMYEPPSLKGRVYAYCEALGIETHANKRNYTDNCYWNLDSPELQSLKSFLLELSK